MNMPVFDCPVCRTTLTWDVVFAHQGVRDMMLALVDAHTEGAKLLRPMLAYIGLFAPNKTTMRYERIAHLARELVTMIREAQVKRDGTVYAAPLDYWINAFSEVLARRDAGTLRLPLSSHGYLIEIIVGYSKKAEAVAETLREKQRAGHAGYGAPTRNEPEKKSEMPQHIRDQISEIKDKLKRR